MSDIAECAASLKVQPEVNFPDTPFFAGAEAPCRFEAEVYNCVVRGTIPPEIDGTYYRCMPDVRQIRAVYAPFQLSRELSGATLLPNYSQHPN